MDDLDLIGAELFELEGADFVNAEPGTEDNIQGVVTRLMERAVAHFEDTLEPDMVTATDYYHGRPFGNEEEGRSQVVDTTIRDVTQAQLPQLIRIFTGPDRMVEFTGRGEAAQRTAEQMTSAVEATLHRGNQGFLTLHAAFKDALVRRLGWVKWAWDATPRMRETRYGNLTQEGLFFLIQQFGEEAVEVYNVDPDPQTGAPLISATVRRRDESGKAKVMAVPPEEIIFSPNARSIDESPIIAHRRFVPRDELLAMGIDEDVLDNAAADHARTPDSALSDARQFHYGGGSADPEVDPANYDGDPARMPILFAEVYGMFDGDEDDISELRLFECVGPNYTITNGEEDANGDRVGEIVDDIPLAFFCMDPEPHTIVGLSNFDYHRDIQLIKSQIERGALNSLAATIDQKTEVVMGEVNLKDLTSPEVSGIVRVRKPGMMREITHTFVGGECVTMAAYYDEKKENRSGISKAAAGLDPDSLQSSTRAAVAATVSGAEQHIWLIAQIFAETGMKRLFRGLAKLLYENMPPGELVRLNSGQEVPVDPRTWDLDLEIIADVALGIGTGDEKMAKITGILEKQETYLQQGVPFVKFNHIRATLKKAITAMGYRNDEEFFAPWGPEEQAAWEQQQAQQEPPPDLNQMLIEVERMKVQLQQIEAENKRKTEEFKAQLEDAFNRDKMRVEEDLKREELAIKRRVAEKPQPKPNTGAAK